MTFTKFGKYVATHKWLWLTMKYTYVPVCAFFILLAELVTKAVPEALTDYREAIALCETEMKKYRDSLVVPAVPGTPAGGHTGVNPPKQPR